MHMGVNRGSRRQQKSWAHVVPMHMGVNRTSAPVQWHTHCVVPMHMGVNRNVSHSPPATPTLSPCTWG